MNRQTQGDRQVETRKRRKEGRNEWKKKKRKEKKGRQEGNDKYIKGNERKFDEKGHSAN